MLDDIYFSMLPAIYLRTRRSMVEIKTNNGLMELQDLCFSDVLHCEHRIRFCRNLYITLHIVAHLSREILPFDVNSSIKVKLFLRSSRCGNFFLQLQSRNESLINYKYSKLMIAGRLILRQRDTAILRLSRLNANKNGQ